MAAASLPSLLFCLRPTSRVHFTAIRSKPDRWRLHHQQHATTQMWRRGVPRRPLCSARSNDNPGLHPIPFSQSLSDVVRDFYASINEKDMSKLEKLIADSCVYEDLAFSKPFEGKEVHRFLKKLTEAMGKHVRFSIERVYEGGETFIGVMWHLEWNGDPIPFTKGCSFYECLRDGQKLRIKRARSFVESPVKPGDIVLELLKIVSLFLDKFPKLAKYFSHKPNMMIRFIMKACKIFIEPFILPLLVYYTHLWTFAVRIIRYVLILVQNLLKFVL